MKRPAISLQTIKNLCATSQRTCAFPGCGRPLTCKVEGVDYFSGEFCHIEGVQKKAARYNPARTPEHINDPDNLVLMCPEHHKIIDAMPDKFPAERIREFKRAQEQAACTDISPEDRYWAEVLFAQLQKSGKVVSVYNRSTHNETHDYSRHVAGDDNSVNVTSHDNSSPHVTINQIYGKVKRRSSAPIEGTIGSDSDKIKYATYLYKKLIDYKAKTNLIPKKRAAIIVANKVEDKFGVPLKDIPLKREDELLGFLISEIERTVPGRSAKKNCKRAYKIYAEHIAGMRANTITGPGTYENIR